MMRGQARSSHVIRELQHLHDHEGRACTHLQPSHTTVRTGQSGREFHYSGALSFNAVLRL